MRAEGFELQVYCDFHSYREHGRVNCMQGYGHTRAEAYRMVRKAGWTLGKRDKCPDCRAEGRTTVIPRSG